MKIASGIPLFSETQKTHIRICAEARAAKSTIGRGRGRSMAPTVSSSASLEQFVLSPSPGDPAVPAPELSDWLEKSLFHFHTSFSDPSVSMYPELNFRDSNNLIRCVFDVTTPGTLWVYRSLHRALRLLRAWAEEGAGAAQKKHLCPPEMFVEGIQWYINEAVPAVFATPLETVPTILLETNISS